MGEFRQSAALSVIQQLITQLIDGVISTTDLNH